jgi:uncharacterized protein YecA (UPF0149 family)
MILGQFKNELSRRIAAGKRAGEPMITQTELDNVLTGEYNKAKLMYASAGVQLDDLLAVGRDVLANADTVETVEELPKQVQIVKAAIEKIGRNEKCPCGSGLKYKKCCGR